MKSLQVIKADNLGIGNNLVYLHLGRAVLDLSLIHISEPTRP